MEIEGQVTISLETFNQLQKRAARAELLEMKMGELKGEITDIID